MRKEFFWALAVFVLVVSGSGLFAESIGVPNATLPQGKIAFGAKYSYFDREIERDLLSGIPLDPRMPRPGDITFFKDNFDLRTNRVYGVISYGIYNTMEDAGALPIELDVSQMNMGDVVELRPYEGKALKDGKVIAEFQVKSDVLFDEVRAGGRIPLIIGRGLTAKV